MTWSIMPVTPAVGSASAQVAFLKAPVVSLGAVPIKLEKSV